jgi:hypothetical protein
MAAKDPFKKTILCSLQTATYDYYKESLTSLLREFKKTSMFLTG